MADTGAVQYSKQVPSATHLRLISMESILNVEVLISGIQIELAHITNNRNKL